MPTWRKLHAKTLDSVDVNAMPDDFTRLLWVLMPLVLDSAGRAIDNSGWLRSKIFPMRADVTTEQVEAAMVWYAARNMIERYEIDARHYFYVPTFEKYQGKTDREAPSEIPAPPKKRQKSGRKQGKSLMTNSRPTHEPVVTNSCLDVDVDVDVEEKREELAGVPPASAPAPVNEPPSEKPDPVKDLAAVFEQAAGIPLPPPAPRGRRDPAGVPWWNALRRMVALANGQSEALLRLTVQKMRDDGLTIAAPISCLNVFTSLYGEQQTRAAQPAAFTDYT